MLKIINTNVSRIGYDFYADIAERIVEKRRQAKLTQAQLSKASGISEEKISRYESVQIRCEKEYLEKIASALCVSIDWLIGAEYDDPDCKDCLYTVMNEREKDRKNPFALYIKASSPQMAFLNAYALPFNKKFRWFEARDRAIVTLVGTPLREIDCVKELIERRPGEEDELIQ